MGGGLLAAAMARHARAASPKGSRRDRRRPLNEFAQRTVTEPRASRIAPVRGSVSSTRTRSHPVATGTSNSPSATPSAFTVALARSNAVCATTRSPSNPSGYSRLKPSLTSMIAPVLARRTGSWPSGSRVFPCVFWASLPLRGEALPCGGASEFEFSGYELSYPSCIGLISRLPNDEFFTNDRGFRCAFPPP